MLYTLLRNYFLSIAANVTKPETIVVMAPNWATEKALSFSGTSGTIILLPGLMVG